MLGATSKVGVKHLFAIVLGLVVGGGLKVSAVTAAETVSFWYGPFQRSVSVADLRQYATTEVVSPDLAGLFAFVKPRTRQEVRKVLNYKIPLDVVTLSRLLDSDPGSKLLSQFSSALVRKDDAGILAMRGGLILGAASKEGLSVLTFLEAYPNSELGLNIPKFFQVLKSTKDLPSLLLGR